MYTDGSQTLWNRHHTHSHMHGKRVISITNAHQIMSRNNNEKIEPATVSYLSIAPNTIQLMSCCFFRFHCAPFGVNILEVIWETFRFILVIGFFFFFVCSLLFYFVPYHVRNVFPFVWRLRQSNRIVCVRWTNKWLEKPHKRAFVCVYANNHALYSVRNRQTSTMLKRQSMYAVRIIIASLNRHAKSITFTSHYIGAREREEQSENAKRKMSKYRCLRKMCRSIAVCQMKSYQRVNITCILCAYVFCVSFESRQTPICLFTKYHAVVTYIFFSHRNSSSYFKKWYHKNVCAYLKKKIESSINPMQTYVQGNIVCDCS